MASVAIVVAAIVVVVIVVVVIVEDSLIVVTEEIETYNKQIRLISRNKLMVSDRIFGSFFRLPFNNKSKTVKVL